MSRTLYSTRKTARILWNISEFSAHTAAPLSSRNDNSGAAVSPQHNNTLYSIESRTLYDNSGAAVCPQQHTIFNRVTNSVWQLRGCCMSTTQWHTILNRVTISVCPQHNNTLYSIESRTLYVYNIITNYTHEHKLHSRTLCLHNTLYSIESRTLYATA